MPRGRVGANQPVGEAHDVARARILGGGRAADRPRLPRGALEDDGVGERIVHELAERPAGRVEAFERLVDVLLCLFDGVPVLVHIEEPRQGVQYGVDLGAGGPEIHLRDAVNTLFLDQLFTKPPLPHRVKVPFRNGGAPGVINVMHLYERMRAVPATKISSMFAPGAHSALFAMQMLQFPFRQVFGHVAGLTATDGEPAGPDAFRPTIALDEMREWEEGS